MTNLLLLFILSVLKPDLENQLFSLVGFLLRLAFIIIGISLYVWWAVVYPGPALGLPVIFAIFSLIAVVRQKYIDRRMAASSR